MTTFIWVFQNETGDFVDLTYNGRDKNVSILINLILLRVESGQPDWWWCDVYLANISLCVAREKIFRTGSLRSPLRLRFIQLTLHSAYATHAEACFASLRWIVFYFDFHILIRVGITLFQAICWECCLWENIWCRKNLFYHHSGIWCKIIYW